MFKMQKIYLDNAATTKPDASILNVVCLETIDGGFFNPSALYSCGRTIRKQIDEARSEVLRLFPNGYDLVFTSGGTEADNLAIFSFAKRGNVITCNAEHSAVNNSFNQLKQRGLDVRFAPVNVFGGVDEEKLLSLVDEKTTFVSLVHVNNETGAINDINKIAQRVKQKNPKVIFHSDGVQAFLKIPFKMSNYVDLYSVSAHKVCALKGTGALIYKKGLNLNAQLFGGGQERGFRSGTENVFGIEVFKRAVKKYDNVAERFQAVTQLKRVFCENISNEVKFVSSNDASPYVISLSIPGIKAEILQRVLDDNGVLVGTGSACSAKIGTSRIINACGLEKRVAEGVIRVSFGFSTTQEEVLRATDIINDCIAKLRVNLK